MIRIVRKNAVLVVLKRCSFPQTPESAPLTKRWIRGPGSGVRGLWDAAVTFWPSVLVMHIEMHGHIDPLCAVFQHGVRQNTDEPTFAPQVRAY